MIQLITLPFILLLFITHTTQAQTNTANIREIYGNRKIAATTLLGSWTSIDSSKTRIEFADDNYYMIIKPKEHVDYYRFTKEKDSVSVSGVAANWPPYDCILNLINNDTLEIKYYQYFSTQTFDVIYTRAYVPVEISISDNTTKNNH